MASTETRTVDLSFIKHPQQLIEYELSDLAEGSGAWRGVNRPLLFFVDGTLYAAQAATPGVLGDESLDGYSGPGTQRTFIVDLSDDAPARIVAELAGHPSAIRVDDGRVSVALYGSLADAELAHWVASSSAPGHADQWATREVPGQRRWLTAWKQMHGQFRMEIQHPCIELGVAEMNDWARCQTDCRRPSRTGPGTTGQTRSPLPG